MILAKRIQIDFKVEPSASEWQLYEPQSASSVAASCVLNATLVSLVNEGKSRREVEHGMYEQMRAYRDLGAIDSEPLRYLEWLLDRIYREES